MKNTHVAQCSHSRLNGEVEGSLTSSSRMRGSIQLLSLLVLSVFLLAACGGDSRSNANSDDAVNTGTLKDSRDGRTYKTVTIGERVWMAENLNYKTENSYCYLNDEAFCDEYGRLYTWAAAMDSAAKWSKNGKGCGDGKKCSPTEPARGVCPSGWHLPKIEEFIKLFDAVGGTKTAGKKLKSTSGWYRTGNGTDDYSFTALPAGFRFENGQFENVENSADFWASTEISDGIAYAVELFLYNNDANTKRYKKNHSYSVRCVQD